MSADVVGGVTEAMVDAAIRVEFDTRQHERPPVSDEALERLRAFYRAVLTAALAAQPNVPTPQQVEAAARVLGGDATGKPWKWDGLTEGTKEHYRLQATRALGAALSQGPLASATGGRGGERVARGDTRWQCADCDFRTQHDYDASAHKASGHAVNLYGITDERLEAIEEHLGMGAGAWDMVKAKAIVAAVLHVYRSPAARGAR